MKAGQTNDEERDGRLSEIETKKDIRSAKQISSDLKELKNELGVILRMSPNYSMTVE